MVETTPIPSIVVDLIGDLDVRLGEMAAQTLRRLAPDRKIILSLRNLTSVHSDGFLELVQAVKARLADGASIAIVAKGVRTKAMLSAARLNSLVVTSAEADGEPTWRRLLLARHASNS
jgi:anti-anti-sigma factor